MECPSCRSSAVLQDHFRAENICTRCGLIIVEKMPEAGPEWRYEPGKDTGRADTGAGVDITQHDFGLGTRLGTGGDLLPSWRARLRRLRMWQDRSRASTYGEKSLREALIELDKLCEDFALPKGVKSEISLLYRKVKAGKLALGRNTWQILAALTFITCRLRGIPRTEDEMVRVLMTRADMQEKSALRGLRQLVKLCINKMKLSMPRLTPDDLLDKFASKVNLPRQTIAHAQKICNMLPEKLKHTKPPTLLAAAVLCVAAKETDIDVTIRKLAETLDVGVSGLSQTAALVRKSSKDRQQ
jgi:transcription initiation factor TFIIB